MSFLDKFRKPQDEDQAEAAAPADTSSHTVTPEPEAAPVVAVEPTPVLGDAFEAPVPASAEAFPPAEPTGIAEPTGVTEPTGIAEPTGMIDGPSLAAPVLPEPAVAPEAAQGHYQPQPGEPMVRVYDEYGREHSIPASEWRDRVLPNALEASRNNPDQLGAVLSDALELGLAAEVLPAARELAATDPIPERGAVILGAALRESGDVPGSIAFLNEALERLPNSALLLLNLAQAYQRLGQVGEADAAVWRSLEADPNLPQTLGWYAQRAREEEQGTGAAPELLDAAWLNAVERVATLPGAWLPQIWMGKAALNRNDLPGALSIYETAIARVSRPVPHAMLQSLSGDLGQHGYLNEALAVSLPLYDAEFHGLAVGNNIIKLLADTGDLDQAQAKVDELYRQGRAEWQNNLEYWVADLDRRRRGEPAGQPGAAPNAQQQQQLAILAIEGPVWLPQGSPARTLYPDTTNARARVLFLGASVAFPDGSDPNAFQQQMPEAAGRLSRALPLFLSEGSSLLLGLDTVDLLPWSSLGGFAVLGGQWPDQDAAALAVESRAGIAIVSHLKLLTLEPSDETSTEEAQPAEAVITLRALRVLPISSPTEGAPQGPRATTEVLASAEVPLRWNELPKAVVSAWSQIAHALVVATGDNPTPLAANRYGLPRGNDLGGYLLRLEQCLAVRCASSVPPGQNAAPFLFGEREIVRGMTELALRYPNSLPCRLVLNETLERLRAIQPAAVAEQKDAVTKLTERHLLMDPDAHRVITEQVRAIFA